MSWNGVDGRADRTAACTDHPVVGNCGDRRGYRPCGCDRRRHLGVGPPDHTQHPGRGDARGAAVDGDRRDHDPATSSPPIGGTGHPVGSVSPGGALRVAVIGGGRTAPRHQRMTRRMRPSSRAWSACSIPRPASAGSRAGLEMSRIGPSMSATSPRMQTPARGAGLRRCRQVAVTTGSRLGDRPTDRAEPRHATPTWSETGLQPRERPTDRAEPRHATPTWSAAGLQPRKRPGVDHTGATGTERAARPHGSVSTCRARVRPARRSATASGSSSKARSTISEASSKRPYSASCASAGTST